MDRGARQATVHGVAKRWTQLSNFHFNHFNTEDRDLAPPPPPKKKKAIFRKQLLCSEEIFKNINNILKEIKEDIPSMKEECKAIKKENSLRTTGTKTQGGTIFKTNKLTKRQTNYRKRGWRR